LDFRGKIVMPKTELTKHYSVRKNVRKKNGSSSNVDYDGAGDGIRTRDSLLGRQELYH
jgi:hypothetical protein